MFDKESLTIKDAFLLGKKLAQSKELSDRDIMYCEKSREVVQSRCRMRPEKISFPESLPISAVREDIVKTVKDNQVIILCGETGSGKTTQLPKILYSLGYGIRGRIGCTQPRRLAAVSMAKRVADELPGCSLGKQVGYKVRFDEKLSKETSIKFMTDGILLAETVSDRNLLEYDAIIIDEAHERSLNIDFILGYINRLLARRKDLKVIISSATLDAVKFSEFFNNAPMINVKGRTYPVEVYHLPMLNDNEDLSRHILRAVNMLNDIDDMGDILVFLPGEREIRDAADLLKGQRWDGTEILPLYARLTIGEQQRIFTIGRYRRIILSTNVAETSLTIPGIHYVIDSGLVRMKRYNPRSQVESLQIEQVSKAAARQRQGRCGRIAEGICIRLYDEQVFDDSEEFTAPEILRTSLADVILHMKMIKLPDIEVFPFIDPPKRNQVREGLKTLYEIGALDRSNNLTDLGRTIGRFSIDPRLARMLVEGYKLKIFTEVSWLVAVLSIQDPRDFPIDRQEESQLAHRQWSDDRSDFLFFLHLRKTFDDMKNQGASKSAIRRFCRKNFLNYMRVREWENLQRDLKNTARELKWKNLDTPLNIARLHYDHFHRCIICGVPMHIGVKNDEKGYNGTAGKKFYIFPGSSLFSKLPEWLISFNLVETSRLYARMAAQINPDLIEQSVPYLCKTVYSNPVWDAERGFVCAEKTVSMGGLTVSQKKRAYFGKVNPAESRKIFIMEGLIPANIRLKGKWFRKYRKILEAIKVKEVKLRRPASGVDFQKVYSLFDESIPKHINSARDLDRWTYKHRDALNIELEDIMSSVIQNVNDHDFPDYFVRGGDKFRVEYIYNPGHDEDGATVYIPANRLFMLTEIDQDWLVNGWVEQKALLVLKTLEKSIRMQLNPLAGRAVEFAADVRSGKYDGIGFMEALVLFIRSEFDLFIGKDDMDVSRLPDWFIPRIAVLNSKNQVISVSRDVSKIEKSIPEKELLRSEEKNIFYGFPEDGFAEKGELNGKTVYHALKRVDNGFVIEHYVSREDALAELYASTAFLFRKNNPKQIQFLEKKLPLDIQTRLTLVSMNSKHLDDFIDASIYSAFDSCGGVPRSAAEFEAASDEVRGELYECGQKLARQLSTITGVYGEVMDDLERVSFAEELTQDVDLQLKEIFYSGFLLKANIMDILRWLNGIRKRIERASYDVQKDLQKMQNILPYRDKVHELMNTGISPGVAELLVMFQEYRISIFAPEVGRRIKVSEKKIRKIIDAL